MGIRKEKVLNLFLVIINLIVVIKLLKDSFRINGFNYALMGLFIVEGLLIYLFFSSVLKGKKKKLIFFIGTICILGLLGYKYPNEFLQEMDYIFQNIVKINNAALEGRDIDFSMFKSIFAIVIPIIVSLCLWLTMKWNKFIVVFTSFIYIGFWYLIFYEKVISNIPFFIGVFTASIGIGEYVNRYKEYEGRELKININKTMVVTTILILTIVLPLIVRFLPQDFKGKSTEGLFQSMKNQFSGEKLTESDYINKAIKHRFSMRQSGYSDSNYSLGGPIKINKRQVFTVKADKPYYLRARVKNTYSGNSWTAEGEKVSEQLTHTYKYEGGINYLYEAFNGLGDIKAEEKTMVISPGRNFKSGSCFTPSGTFKIEEVEKKIFYNDIPTFMSEDYIREPYMIKFLSYGAFDNYIENIDNEAYFNHSYNIEYSIPSRKYGQLDIDYYSYLESLVDTTDPEELQQYNKFKWNYINYLQVPDIVGEEVYVLVANILRDEVVKNGVGTVENLSSQQKALAIMNFLKENYKYKTDVNEVDPQKDFVTQFLIEEKVGYCTYFASANTIMCRIAGIPARYVEGFNMDNEKNYDGEYIVTNEEAHAWTEILVNPYEDMWAISDAVPAASEEIGEVEPELPIEEDPVIDDSTVDNPKNPMKEKPDGDKDMSLLIRTLWIVLTLLIIIILILVLIVSSFVFRRKRVILSGSILPLYKYSLRRLNTIGIKKAVTQGDLEFAKAIEDVELRAKMIKLAKIVYDEFYGEINCHSFDKKEFINYIETYVKMRTKGYKYIVKKYCSFTVKGGY